MIRISFPQIMFLEVFFSFLIGVNLAYFAGQGFIMKYTIKTISAESYNTFGIDKKS